ncbi:MAG: FHIPEP family type III secretion protein [bacterium]
MFENIKTEYSVKICPSNEPENLENLLNKMGEEGWELYMLHEIDSKSGESQYNCIFYREYNEIQPEKIIDLDNFKTRIEKILNSSNEPYEECKEIQKKLNQKHKKLNEIKNLIDSTSPNNTDHKKLNEEISGNLKELDELKEEFANIIDSDRMYDRINQDKLTIIISDELTSLVNNEKDSELISETVKLRQNLVDKLGYVIPSIRFTDSEILEANEYRIDARGLKILLGTVNPGYVRFYKEQLNISRKPKGTIEDIDPINKQNVLWIEESKAKNFWEKGLNPAQVISNNLEYIVCRYVDEILDFNDINRYIGIVYNNNPYLIENLIPEFLTVSDLKYIFAGLIRERISVKDLVYIFERLNDLVQYISGRENLLERLRIALNRQICNNIADTNNVIYGIIISDSLVEKLKDLLMNKEKESFLALKNPVINKFTKNILNIVKNFNYNISNIALITPSFIRLQIFLIIEQTIPGLSVISKDEIASEFNLEIIENLI